MAPGYVWRVGSGREEGVEGRQRPSGGGRAALRTAGAAQDRETLREEACLLDPLVQLKEEGPSVPRGPGKLRPGTQWEKVRNSF